MITVTQPEEKKPRQSPVPQKAEAITAGALKLSLQERVTLTKTLEKSINDEVAGMKAKLDEALGLVSK